MEAIQVPQYNVYNAVVNISNLNSKCYPKPQYMQFEPHISSHTETHTIKTYNHPCQSPPNPHTAWIALHVNHWDRPYIVIESVEIVYNQIVCFAHEAIGCTLEMQTKSILNPP